jgi:phosphoribosylformylglycinamidine synthase
MLRDDGAGGIGGAVPEIDPERNMAAYRALTAAMSKELVASAHDCSDGGLAVALAECCFGSDSGAKVDINPIWSDCDHLDAWGALFGESLGRILVSTSPDDREAFEKSMEGVACYFIGDVSEGDEISFTRESEVILSASMQGLRESWKGTLHGGGQ